MMTKYLLGVLFAIGAAAPASAGHAPSCPAPTTSSSTTAPAQDDDAVLQLPAPVPMSCTAQGHDCEDKKECCSGMCVKKKGGGKKCA